MRLGGVWLEPSPPSAIDFETLREFTAPGSVLLHRLRDDQALLETVDPSRAGIRTHCETVSRGNAQGVIPG